MPGSNLVSLCLPPGARAPMGLLPLQGLTLLAVEDSRFASDALRLLCQRSGARLKRAETLAAARRHLTVYRPDAVIVDLGLPDGCGDDLIRLIVGNRIVTGPVLGTSGDPGLRGVALAAGADGFLDKPVTSLAAFQAAILCLLPGPALPAATALPDIAPDPMALHDDLARAADLLAASPGPQERRYVSAFLGGVARSARDGALARAAGAAGASADALPDLSALLADRLAQAPGPFAPDG